MFVFPVLGRYEIGLLRLGGSGLGNLLFPWARAQLLARDHGFNLIEPTWPNLRVGSIVRREADLRFYYDLFEGQPGSIKGIAKLKLLALAPRMSEQTFKNTRQRKPGYLVMVTGLSNYFADIKHEQTFIAQTLLNITREQHKVGWRDRRLSDAIVLHIRRGDFNVGGIATPLAWYMRIVQSLRDHGERQRFIYVFSDGTDDELKPLLGLPGVARLGFYSSLADLLAMSRAKVLVGSRYSTFSMWAAYLGGMPTLWPAEGTKETLYAGLGVSDRILTSPDGVVTRSQWMELLS